MDSGTFKIIFSVANSLVEVSCEYGFVVMELTCSQRAFQEVSGDPGPVFHFYARVDQGDFPARSQGPEDQALAQKSGNAL